MPTFPSNHKQDIGKNLLKNVTIWK